jgi:arylsulfatase A-like enzyme
MFRLPGGAVRKRVSSFVPTQAILPTLLELVGIEPETREGWAASLAPLLDANAEDRYSDPIVSGANHDGQPQWTVVLGALKYMRRESGVEELYDISRDPQERLQIAADHPDAMQRARAVLEDHYRFAQRVLKQKPAVGIDKDKYLDRLRSLGYLL